MLRSIILNPNRSWVHDRGPQQNSIFLPWTGVLKMVDWVPFVGLCWVPWPELRCWGYRNNLEWLHPRKTLRNWCIWVILYLSFGAWITRRATVLPRLVAKPCERGFLFARIEWCLTMRRITGRSLGTVAGGLIVIGWVAVESQGIVVEAQLGRALLCPPGLLGEDVEGECGECVRSESFLEKFDPQFQQLKEEAKRKERTVELQERGGGVCPGHERTFYQTLDATVVFFLSTFGFYIHSCSPGGEVFFWRNSTSMEWNGIVA